MTRIDCKMARANGLKPGQYVGSFVERQGNEILLATDEERNDKIRLDVDSAVFLSRLLLKLAGEIQREVRG